MQLSYYCTMLLRHLNEQLKIHQKMQNDFINIASHEIKTPTQSILLHSNHLICST